MIYALFLGGKHPNANVEIHDLVFVDCFDEVNKFKADKEKITSKWFGSSCHIDAYKSLEIIDNYKIIPSQNTQTDLNLFAINFGGQISGIMPESHDIVFVVAKNKSEAIKKGKAKLKAKMTDIHLDDLLDISEITGQKFEFIKTDKTEDELVNCYIKL
jgi:hypothetical protein